MKTWFTHFFTRLTLEKNIPQINISHSKYLEKLLVYFPFENSWYLPFQLDITTAVAKIPSNILFCVVLQSTKIFREFYRWVKCQGETSTFPPHQNRIRKKRRRIAGFWGEFEKTPNFGLTMFDVELEGFFLFYIEKRGFFNVLNRGETDCRLEGKIILSRMKWKWEKKVQ